MKYLLFYAFFLIFFYSCEEARVQYQTPKSVLYDGLMPIDSSYYVFEDTIPPIKLKRDNLHFFDVKVVRSRRIDVDSIALLDFITPKHEIKYSIHEDSIFNGVITYRNSSFVAEFMNYYGDIASYLVESKRDTMLFILTTPGLNRDFRAIFYVLDLSEKSPKLECFIKGDIAYEKSFKEMILDYYKKR